ncbi:uncharacterized protein [Amphiura filiformis]|uniref:uncharacterized protein n=1 Tax=Amphiura filiformis TaxID=82378 RepID=UPI003B223E9B
MDIYTICRVACYICLILAQQNIIGVYSANYYRELLDTLFDHTNDYYKVIRPVNDSSVPVNVSMQLVLTDITAVEEINHQIELNVWVRQVWKDAFLTWNETEFGGKEQLVIPGDFIWIPDITLYNGVGDSNDIKAEGLKLVVSSDGSVQWTVKATLRSACQMRLISFPFDRQECILRFGSWSYDGTLVNLDILGGVAGFDAQSEYHANSEWDLLSAIAYRKEISYLIPSTASGPPVVLTWPEAFFAIKLKRKFTFYLFTLLVPYFIISSLSGLVFYLQPESGEKMGLAVTTLLSLVVFNEYVMSIVPPSADFFPLLTEYFTIMICWVGMCVLISTWILHIHHQDPKDCSRMGPRLRVFIFVYMARVVGRCDQTKKNDSTSAEDDNRNNKNISVVKIQTDNGGLPGERSLPDNEMDSAKAAEERSSSSPENEMKFSKVTTVDIAEERSLYSPENEMDSSKVTIVDIAGERSPSSPEGEMIPQKAQQQTLQENTVYLHQRIKSIPQRSQPQTEEVEIDERGMLGSQVYKISQFLKYPFLNVLDENKRNDSASAEDDYRNSENISFVKVYTEDDDLAGVRNPGSPDIEMDTFNVTITEIVGERIPSSPEDEMDSSEVTTTDIAGGEQSPSSPANVMDFSKVTDGRGMLESDVNKIRQFLLTKEEEERKKEEEVAPLQEWREAAKIVDQFFFGLYNGVNIFLVLVFTLKSVTASYTIEHDF